MSSLLRSFFFFLLFFLLPPITTSSSSCNSTELDLITKAFTTVKNLQATDLLNSTTCTTNITEIKLPSRNLTGTISWIWLSNITTLHSIDLSNNSLHGSIPSKLWESSTSLLDLNLASNQLGGTIRFKSRDDGVSKLQKLNLSDNRFTNSGKVSGFEGLRVLDLSRNHLRSLPSGIEKLRNLERLDLSRCNMSGNVKPISALGSLKYLDLSMNNLGGFFPKDFPTIDGLVLLNISFNNFTGLVKTEQRKKFGVSAFTSSGALLQPSPSTRSGSRRNNSSTTRSETKPKQKPISPFPKNNLPSQQREQKEIRKNKKNDIKKKLTSRAAVLGTSIGGASVALMAMVCCCCCCCICRNKMEKKKKRKNRWTKQSSGFDTEAAWVMEATGTSTSSVAPVIMFEKPLMNLTFSDLVVATSRFGKESQLADGNSTGPIYRAILPGEIDVAIKVLEKARAVEGAEAKVMFQELASVKHPNLLLLVGYCIAGKEKLLLYEYMENGDLHRWLHELPLMERHRHDVVEDWNADMDTDAANTVSGSWPTRYRIALGIARGLAFLHHASGKGPVVHGRVIASNVLLDEEFEPRITGVGTTGAGTAGSVDADVYGYGVVLMELLTGRVGSAEMAKSVRELVKVGNGLSSLDPRVRLGAAGSDSEEGEMGEALRVAYLCTAESGHKRPTMRQVVGLLKDLRPLAT